MVFKGFIQLCIAITAAITGLIGGSVLGITGHATVPLHDKAGIITLGVVLILIALFALIGAFYFELGRDVYTEDDVL